MRFTIYGRLDGLNEYTNANRNNPYAGAKMKKKNEEAVLNSLVGRTEHFTEPVYLRFFWVEPNRRRDKDNICSAKKFIQDALVKKGILDGDGWKYIVGFSDRFYVDKDNPRVEVEILTEAEREERQKAFIEDAVQEYLKSAKISPVSDENGKNV